MSVQLVVLYPNPTDVKEFHRRYTSEHLPMGKSSMKAATNLSSYRIVGSPSGKADFAQMTVITFPSFEALKETAALPAVQKTIANAVEISTGGAPHFLILQDEAA